MPDDPALGSVSGSVEDAGGNLLPGATLTLTPAAGGPSRTAVTDVNGHFRFAAVPPGQVSLSAAAPKFSATGVDLALHPGEQLEAPPVVMAVATAVADVTVTVSHAELAEEEVHAEEKQRVLAIVPNFLVTYDWHALSLSPKQKLELAWRMSIDPFAWVVTGAVAGVQQADNAFPGYGQGASGYAKRYGADFSDQFIGTMLGSGVLPIVFHQDPRYFVKGSGTVKDRALYAMSMTVVARKDSGGWGPNYSNVLGAFGAAGISNLYYPPSSRNGAGLTLENAGISLASQAATNLLEEFIVRRLTPHLPPAHPAP